MKPLYLLDGYSLIYRSYFAFIRNPLINPDGKNVSATFGFFRTLFSFFDQFSPELFAVVLDSRTPTFRHKRYPEYKATREKAPDDLHAAVPVIEEILAAIDVPTLQADGFEADDIIATLAAACRDQERDCYIITGDKDLLQLVGEHVWVLKPDKSTYAKIGTAEVVEDWGVRADQILDYLSLIGDTADNVPGVKGIGPKSAAKFLSDFENLDGVYANLPSLTKSQSEKLAQDKDKAYLSKELITLRYDVPLDRPIEGLAVDVRDRAKAVPIFQREGLKQLAEQSGGGTAKPEGAAGETSMATTMPGMKATTGSAKTAGDSAGRSGSEKSSTGEAEGLNPPGSEVRGVGTTGSHLYGQKKGRYVAVTDAAELDRWIERVKRSRTFAFDSETDSIDAVEAKPVGFSLSVKSGEACYIPLKAGKAKCLSEEVVRLKLKTILEDSTLRLIGQNIKYDYKVLKRWGITLRPSFDTMIAAWLIDTTRGSYNMDTLAEWYLGYQTVHFKDVVPEGATFDSVELESATDYAAEDADITFRLYETFAPMIDEKGLQTLFTELEMPLIPVLGDMELEGIKLVPAILETYSGKLAAEIAEVEKQVYRICGREFNLNSTKQLQEILFEDLGMKPIKKTRTGYSTDNAVLEELAGGEGAAAEVPTLVLRYRLLSKLKSTYVDTLPKLVNPRTGRIHTHYGQTGTATGRLSSKDPNLQNIPIREEEGRQIRAAFVPREGHLFLSADYSQIELVVLAHLTGDAALKKAFIEGKDVHSQTGSLIFGVPDTEVTPEQRRIAKTINFGVMYGMSAFRLSRQLKIPRRMADEFIEAYFAKYSNIRDFVDRTAEETKTSGYVRTLMGRIRPIPAIGSRNRTEQMAAQRIAVNTPIQGSAADIVKLAMLHVVGALAREELESRLILQVHDELVFEVPEVEIDRMRKLVRREMEQVVKLDVPLRVSIETGGSWGDLH